MAAPAEPVASVLLVDDHAVIAVPLKMALESSGFWPVMSADGDDLSEEAVLAVAGSLRPDIVLLDIHLGGDRLSLPMVPALVELGGKVILFTAMNDPRLLAKGLRAGAEAVIDKSLPFHKLVATLTGLAAGKPMMTSDEREALLEHLEAHFADDEARLEPFRALTAREAQVLCLLIAGQSPKVIARSEGISVSTVRGHIDRVLAKLGVGSQREALALARAAGWPEQQETGPPGMSRQI